jgi:NADH-quinone oxidoreductase subunit F
MSHLPTILFPSVIPEKKETLAEYRLRGGYEALYRAITHGEPASVIHEIEAARLRGRGGAGFPAARKMALCAQAEGPRKYVVVNGGEDEPGSFKDRTLLEYVPHAVLEGALLAAYAVGAAEIFFYTNHTYLEARERLWEAIEEARMASFIGEELFGSRFTIDVDSKAAPTPYVAGEDTAALEVLEGRDPKPRQKPPYPVTAGLYRHPTLVNNVETLANIPPIVLRGAAWYRSFGTAESPGTMLFCMNEEWARPGAYELPYGTPEGLLTGELAGGLKDGTPLRAILPGGPSSAFLLPDRNRPLSPEALRAAGSSIGCGVMRGYAEGTCMMEAALELANFFAKECCGQCPACRMETTSLATILEKVRLGQAQASALAQVPKILAFNKDKGFCNLVNMPGPPLVSAMQLFPADFEAHRKTGTCARK